MPRKVRASLYISQRLEMWLRMALEKRGLVQLDAAESDTLGNMCKRALYDYVAMVLFGVKASPALVRMLEDPKMSYEEIKGLLESLYESFEEKGNRRAKG